MNKSELETQAEKICVYNDQIHRDCFVNGYVTGALKREQQIADIKANCDLAIEGRDIKIKELEQQIEKMKCCSNCDFVFRDGNCYYDKECKNKDHWKLRR